MSTPVSRLARGLNLSDVDSNEEDLALSIVALLTSAVSPHSKPGITLSKIAHEISISGAASLLDPLDTLPILLPCKDPAAKEILSLVGECSSAKEVVIAVQEAVEVLERAFEGDDGDDEPDTQRLSSPAQLTILVDLYASCIPRLKLRRKTASETIKPLLSELESVARLSGSRSSRDEGRTLISSVSHLVTRVNTWSKLVSDEDNSSVCKEILKSLLDTTLVACEPCIKAFLAQRSFRVQFPRLGTLSAVPDGWEGGQESVLHATNAYLSLGISTTLVHSAPSMAAMIIFAHSRSKTTQLPKLVPVLVSSLQIGSALDEALSILLYAFDPLQAFPRPYLPEDVIHPLFAVLSPLSSSHPDPAVRHQAYRILSSLLSSCPPPIRLRLLVELANDPDFPQMRVASVDLIKQAVLEALAHPPNIFASPTFFDVFGPILFRPNPPDLFSDERLSIDSFKESSEPARLLESLGTYYTILLQDKANLTRIASPDALNWVQTNLLLHLDRALDRWIPELEPEGGPPHDNLLTLGTLKMALERVYDALARVKASEHVGGAICA